MLDNSKKLSIAITDTYALLTYHINEESKINIILSDKDIVRINTNLYHFYRFISRAYIKGETFKN